jgi:NADH-quinone oxidoreductase subunit A
LFFGLLCEKFHKTGPLKNGRPVVGDSLHGFLPVFFYLAAILLFAATTLILAHIIGPRRHNLVKEMPYESGMDPVGDARQHFDVRFYLVAILFLVFDVELLFLYPWAVSAYAETGVPAPLRGPLFAVMLAFIATLAIAYVYAWRKGVFRWR